MTEEDGADNRALLYYEDKTLLFEDDDEYGWIECPQHIHYVSSYQEYVWVAFHATDVSDQGIDPPGEYKKTTSVLQGRTQSFPISRIDLSCFVQGDSIELTF